MRTADMFTKALRHHQAGELAEADRLYRKLLAAEPQHAHALHLRGVLAQQAGRHDDAVKLIGRAIALDPRVADFHYNLGLVHWSRGHRGEAIARWSDTIALNPDHADAHMNLGNALWSQGEPGRAEPHLRRAVALNPRAPAAHNNLGLALAALGRDADAIAQYQHAIALNADFVEAAMNLAVTLQAAGRADEALACARRALARRESPESQALAAEMIAGLGQVRDSAEMRALVMRSLSEGWGRQADVAAVGATLLKLDPALGPAIREAAELWPERLAAQGTFGAADLPADHALLRCLLVHARICDGAIEPYLTACRAALLACAEDEPAREDLIDFACALARQCFATEYVYACTADERARVQALRDAAERALASGGTIAPLRLAVLASYRPLAELPSADVLLAASWPPRLEELLTQQVRDVRAEARARAEIPRLTPIDDAVSQSVREQYEENPYPRWMTFTVSQRVSDLDLRLRRQFPWSPFAPSGAGTRFDALVAGCGTGQHALYVARLYGGARVLAIDLSLASLGYARARTQALGVTNLDYAQADILELGTIARSFDLIESAGVLHHLGDPHAGWRILLERLRPGGFMHVGLYSEIARRHVVTARAAIAARGLGASPDEIRGFREELLGLPEDHPLKPVTRTDDFFSLSDCRDLLFHVSEHRMTLPAIKRFLEENGLRFIGFELDSRTLRAYRARFPDDPSLTDLDRWHVFETENPDTFVGMYSLWLQKPGSELRAGPERSGPNPVG